LLNEGVIMYFNWNVSSTVRMEQELLKILNMAQLSLVYSTVIVRFVNSVAILE